MKIKLLLLILVSALSTATSQAQDDRPANLAWGDHSRGLRMAVWTNAETDKVFAVIRNFAPQKISYREGALTNYEIYARRDAASKWREVKFKPLQSREVIAILNCPTIEPNKEERFWVDLREHDFPADWNGLIEVRIVRFLNITKGDCDEANIILKVKSQAFNVKLPLTGAAAQN